MERLDVFDCSNVFLASYFTDNRECAHCNNEHTLIYIYSGELELTEHGKKTHLRAGQCAFLRRDNLLWLHKHPAADKPYHSIALRFSRDFLREFYQTLNKRVIPADARRSKDSLIVLPYERPDIKSLFESVIPYFEAGVKPSEDILKLKMIEGVYAILNTDENLYASLFDFVDPWKIDILVFLERNFKNELSLEEIASYTGRSLSTFKRDFKKCSDLTPQKWIMQRRLQAAHELIRRGGRRVSDVCYEVGFKNLSHFSKIYKDVYGVSPLAEKPAY